MQLKNILISLGFKEMVVIRCMFVLFIDGVLIAIVMIHVDDLLEGVELSGAVWRRGPRRS